jgi:gag-polypeptide of LTR copia-type
MVFQLGCRSDSLAGHLTNAEVPTSLAGADAETADLEATSRWKHEDAIVRHSTAFSIPDEAFAVVRRGTSAKDFWDNLKARFESKSRWIRVEVMRKLYNQKCGNDDDVRAHLARLFSLQEQLFATGGSISDDDFSYLILDSLPDAYDTLVSSIGIAASFSNKERDLSPIDVNALITSDYERRISKGPTPRSSNRGYRR